MTIPEELRYTKTHEWARQAGGEITVGITAHAQEELRDVVYIELPPVGKGVKQGEATAVVESVKAAFDIYAPISGTITRVNSALANTPELVNKDCYGEGWLFAFRPTQPNELAALLTPAAYTELVQASTH